MIAVNTTRSTAAVFAGLALALGLIAAPLRCGAQVSSYGDKIAGENTGDQLPTVLQKVQVTQQLNAQLPLDAAFVDDTGIPIKLGKYFDGKHPAVVTTVYYNCPMLCSEEMDGLTSALEMVHLVPGKDFQIVIISIDPSETPQLAAQKKEFYLKRYGHPETARNRRGDQGCGLWLCAGAGAGWPVDAVCPCELD